MAEKILNTRPTSSDTDAFPSTLGERQANAFRSVPGIHRGTAMAVTGSDGGAVGASQEEVMQDILFEIRALRLGMILMGTCEEVNDV